MIKVIVVALSTLTILGASAVAEEIRPTESARFVIDTELIETVPSHPGVKLYIQKWDNGERVISGVNCTYWMQKIFSYRTQSSRWESADREEERWKPIPPGSIASEAARVVCESH